MRKRSRLGSGLMAKGAIITCNLVQEYVLKLGRKQPYFRKKKHTIFGCCPTMHSENLPFHVKGVLLNQFLKQAVPFCFLTDLALNFQTIL